MSNGAKRFGGKNPPATEQQKVSRTIKDGADSNDNECQDWLESNIIKSPPDRRELTRRVGSIKYELINTLLSPDGHLPTGNDLITHTNVLIQLPILLFIYKQQGEEYIHQPHFDLPKTKISRQSLKLCSSKLIDDQNLSIKSNKLNNLKDTDELFSIFNTDFYIRCFLLDTSEDDQPFYEIGIKSNSFANMKRFIKSTARKSMEFRYEYARICLNGLLSFHPRDNLYYNHEFQKEINSKLNDILTNFIYITPHNKDRATLTIASKEDAEYANEIIGNYYNENSIYKSLIHSRLDKTYCNASYAAYALKLLGGNAISSENSFLAPNIFIMTRAYNRESRRASQNLKDDYHFKGYAFNIRFEFPETQRKEIRNYLIKLSEASQYPRTVLSAYKNVGINEFFGGYANSKDLKWVFDGKKNETIEGEAYANFSRSLDDWFWGILKKIHSSSSNRNKEKLLNKLIDILSSTIGAQSTSMVDPIFYYGASIYRMPFRRKGGLGRLHELSEVYESLPDTEKMNFCINHLRRISIQELRTDCYRVILFFYLSRMLASHQYQSEKYDTKVHFYPIDIGGAIAGAIGKVSLDLKEVERNKSDAGLPTDNKTWNQEVIFYTEVVTAVRASLRRQYRDLQIEYLSTVFNNLFSRLLEKSRATKTISRQELNNMAEDMNKQSRIISRICPYPKINFRFTEKDEEFSNKFYIDLKKIKLVLETSSDAPIFRHLTKVSGSIIDDNLRGLTSAIFYRAQQLLGSNATQEQ